MRKNIKKEILVVIKNYKGDFNKEELKEKVLKSLEKRGLKNKDENNMYFEQLYNELKARNKFFYVSKETRRKLYIH